MKQCCALFFFCFLFFTAEAQLTGINPAQGYTGQYNLTTTVTSNNLFLAVGSPNGNIYEVYLQQGVNTIPIADMTNMWYSPYPATAVDSSTLDLLFNIPLTAATGTYDLVVTTTDPWNFGTNLQTYTLPSCFNVGPPDGYASGKVFYDVNMNGVFDAGDSALSNQTVVLQPGNTPATTDVNGDYSIALRNGTYTISWQSSFTHAFSRTSDSASYTITMNSANVTGFDFGGVDGLTSLSPAVAFQGETINSILTSLKIFRTGANAYGNITGGVWKSPNGTINYGITRNSFTVLDSNSAQLLAPINPNMSVGIYDLAVTVSGYTFYLRNALTVTAPPSYLSGHIYFDANNNGQFDTGELPIASQRVVVSPENSQGYSNSSGDFSVGSSIGTHTLAWTQSFGNFVISSQPSYSFTNTGNQGGFDFGLRSALPDFTCRVQFYPAFQRCNQNITSFVFINNVSNVVTQGSIYLVHSPNVTFTSANPLQSAVSGDTIFWTFSNLQPLQTQTFAVTLMNPGVGSSVWFQPHIDVEDGFGNVQFSDFGSAYQTIVRCSYDPNDKAVTPEGADDVMHYTLMSDSLDYLIRFQNSGNDTAFTVLIRDTLDPSLDLSTFELIASSHSVETQIDSNRAITFLYNNILLPDSNVNEQGSHGFVRYRIHPKAGLPDPTRVENQAFIYFDQNPAIETNTTWNTLVNQIPVGLGKPVMVDADVYFYPNPMDKQGTFIFKNDRREKMKISLFDISGQDVLKAETNLDNYQISKGNLSSGLYFFQIINSKTGETHKGKIAIR